MFISRRQRAKATLSLAQTHIKALNIFTSIFATSCTTTHFSARRDSFNAEWFVERTKTANWCMIGVKGLDWIHSLIASFMGPTWGPSGADRHYLFFLSIRQNLSRKFMHFLWMISGVISTIYTSIVEGPMIDHVRWSITDFVGHPLPHVHDFIRCFCSIFNICSLVSRTCCPLQSILVEN